MKENGMTDIQELENLTPEELEEAFVKRERDADFSTVGAPYVSSWAEPHVSVWKGYEIVKDSVYLGA